MFFFLFERATGTAHELVLCCAGGIWKGWVVMKGMDDDDDGCGDDIYDYVWRLVGWVGGRLERTDGG